MASIFAPNVLKIYQRMRILPANIETSKQSLETKRKATPTIKMDILETVSVVHVFYQAVGLSQWLLDRQKWVFRTSRMLQGYTVVLIVIGLSILCHGLLSGKDLSRTSEVNEIGQTVDFIQIIGIRLAHVVCIAEALIRRKQQRKFYEQVREIDRVFECGLNVNVDNREFQRNALQYGVLMFAIYMVSELFILTAKIVSIKIQFLLYWTFYLLPLLVCGMRYFQMYTIILIIKRRFDKLIEALGEINLVHDVPTTETSAIANFKVIPHSSPIFEPAKYFSRRHELENSELKRLLIIRDLYNRIWELTTLVNRCFGVSMLINIGNDFISITCNCYWIFLNFREYSSTLIGLLQILCSIVWSLPHLINVLVLAILCERTVQSTTGIALALHHVEIDVLNDNHNILVEQFSLQLLHQKIAFTAAGFFKVDCTLLYTIVAATTTYLIILIQFHMNEQKMNSV